MFDFDFKNIICNRCGVGYPGTRRTCPCCNEYNPAYLADPQGEFCNNDDPEVDCFTDDFFKDEEGEQPCLY